MLLNIPDLISNNVEKISMITHFNVLPYNLNPVHFTELFDALDLVGHNTRIEVFW